TAGVTDCPLTPCCRTRLTASVMISSRSTAGSGGRGRSNPDGPFSRQCSAAILAASRGLGTAAGTRRPPPPPPSPEPTAGGRARGEDGNAEGFQQFRGGGDVQDGLGPGRHDNRCGARELRQVAGDVQGLGETAVHAAGAAGAHEPDPGGPAHGEGPADRGGAE